MPAFFNFICFFCSVIFCTSCLYKKHNVRTDIATISPKQPDISIDSLSQYLLQQMSLKEKVGQMTGEEVIPGLVKLGSNFLIMKRFPHFYSGKNKRLKIPPFGFSDGPRGATVGGPKNTIFPVAMARGASWNRGLEAAVADVIGKEIRANGSNYTGTPCINLLRHPAWGRAQETYGEDPYLLGELGLAYVQTIQKHHVMACPKHFALNSIENARFYINVQIEERALQEVYFPHFKKVIQIGQAASVMSAYNKVRGDWCGENGYLLTDILRKDWGFQGFVSSDWLWGVHDGAAGINAGLDVEMPVKIKYHFSKIKKAVQTGKINVSTINESVLRILKTKLKFALAKDSLDYSKNLKSAPEHIALSQKVAEESMVLLKNQGVLPFQLKTGDTILVIGKLANTRNTGDHGSSSLSNKNVVTIFEGIQNYCTKNNAIAIFYDGKNLEKTKALVQQADKVILAVGYDYKDEGEYIVRTAKNEKTALENADKKGKGGDRKSLELSAEDQELVTEIAPLHLRTVVVYTGGSAITLDSWKQKTPAILFAWYAGMRGGNALANILFGEVNPSGKLPFSIPKKEADLPYFNRFADSILYGYYHGYTWLEKQKISPAFSFGFGLSYTSFRMENLQILNPILNEKDSLVFSINISNTGDRAGAEVCQVYVGFKNSKIDRPVKLLQDFDKVFLQPKEQKTLQFRIATKDLAYYNPDTKTWAIEQMEYELFVGNSSQEETLIKGKFEVKF